MARIKKVCLVLVGCAFALLTFAASAMATVSIQVTTAVDENDSPGAGCSLREALISSTANAAQAGCVSTGTPSESQITFAPSLGASPTINLDGNLGQLSVSANDVTITGPATVNGDDSPAIRVLHGINLNLTLTALTISNGNESAGGLGGGLRQSAGSLTLNSSTVSGNKATISSATNADAQGGGIYSGAAKVTLNNSTVANNQAIATYTGAGAGNATALGGGIQVTGDDVTMENSVVSGNQVLATGNGSGSVGADGGGVRTDGEVLIEHSTISGNLASATATSTSQPVVQGGGLLVHGGSGTVDVELSTIANNLLKATGTTPALQRGGGINDFDANVANYISDTIAGNGLDPASQTTGVEGLNFWSSGAGTRAFSNTIVANPVGSVGTNCLGDTPYSIGGEPNVDFPQDGTAPCFTPGPLIMDVDPQLGALGNNGGPTPTTPTMLPSSTSPVIDQGTADSQNDLTEDQRLFARPVNFPGLPNASFGTADGSDIGSVEVQQACAGQATPTTACSSGGATTVPGPTGERQAALDECKRKAKKHDWPRKKRKKCRNNANQLPD